MSCRAGVPAEVGSFAQLPARGVQGLLGARSAGLAGLFSWVMAALADRDLPRPTCLVGLGSLPQLVLVTVWMSRKPAPGAQDGFGDVGALRAPSELFFDLAGVGEQR